ncbi:mannosyltransferase, putative [Bodo saltans]|uniref:Mannosyltransferase, putative n=1 Tax=Bodo saltans TaxID=75058 RepID=A0A0S4JMU2_BODSA|nr:mannosyltransferase, putative [Bodo saltans]|eukprot:CUG91532.1 mannosyltransferase, putative [Bodo saltans]
MRRGFQVLVEAQELLSTLYGSQWESRNISARMGLSQHTEQSVLSLCGTATTSQQRGSSTSPRAAGQSSSSPPPLPLSQEELTRWIVCITGLLEEQITAVQHWQAVKTATPPEEHIGWALSMAIRKLVSANNKNNKNNASMFVASPAECLVNPHNAMPVLRPFLTAQVEITAGKWLDLPSYPLQLSSAFWQEYKELAEALFPHVFAPFATALRGSTMMINNESSVNNNNNNNSSNASLMPPLRIVWDSFCCHCCGFSNEIVNLLVPLQKRLDVRTPLEPNCFCPGLPDAVENSLERSYMPKHTFPLEIVSPEEVTVWISHTEPTRYVNPVFRKRRPDYVVGRSMYEFTKIKQEWLEPIEKDCDEVWVPAAFVAEAFINSGVNASKVVIIPEALDTYFYDPSAHNRIHLPLPPNGEVLDGESVSSWGSSIKWKHFCNRPADPSTEHHFKFFSNFKWESRKGWDVLFSAYFTAFGSDEPVSLYVLTHIWTNSGVETYDSRHNETYLREHLDELSRKLGLTSDLTRHPHFCIIIDNIEEAGIAQLYRSTDAFVLPTKGEGWGLPVMQAMSMGMPVISTAWGGQTDFMNEDNSFLIPVESVEDIPKDSEYRWEAGIKWAVPSLSATKDLMRIVVTNQTLGMKRGTAARRHIVTHFSEEAVADIVEARLYKIQQIVLERRRQMRRNVSSSSSSTAAPTSLEGAMPSSSSSPSELIIRPQAVNKRNTSVQ